MDFMLALAMPQSWQIALLLGLLFAAILLFATEKLSVDIITLLLLSALIVFGILKPSEAFAGFSDPIIIILASLFIISGALRETGVLDVVGAKLVRLASGGENRLLAGLMVVAAGLSAFMNNTTVTAMLIAPVLGVAKKTGISASRLLMPLAYASILGGTCTLIGTSTNVAVSGYLAQSSHLKPLGLFEFTPIGLIVSAVGIIYMLLIGKRFLPQHVEEGLAEDYAINDYLSEIVVLPKSPLLGQYVFKSDLARLGFRILKVIREKREFAPDSRTAIEENDVLLVTGNIESLMKVKETEGIEINPDFKMSDQELQGKGTHLAEVLVLPKSNLVSRTVREANFFQEFGLTVLAIYRKGRALREQIGAIRLRAGDLLLLQGPKERMDSLRRKRDVALLEELNPGLYSRKNGLYVVGFFLTSLVLGGLGVLPLAVAFLLAALASILSGCIRLDRAYEFIDWRLLILIGGMVAFGTAMETTGTAEMLASNIVKYLQPFGVMPILAGFFVLTILLTQPMSNAAAALVILPVALSAANALGVNERTFAIAIMLAASISFIAPFEPSCILVYGPGKYTFGDFVKSGLPLTTILSVVVLFLIPIFWPLQRPASQAAPTQSAPAATAAPVGR